MANKAAREAFTNNQIRQMVLQYFYDRNANSTSAMGKKGAAVKISDVKKELKARDQLTQQEVQSNLTYLLSQGWVEEKQIKKEFQPRGGSVIPSVTSFYQITAAGIDKIEGPGEFTMQKFHDIKIEATGQNIITLGDGNQIRAEYESVGQTLSDLKTAIVESTIEEANKLGLVADIDTIQTQLAKPEPNGGIIRAAWDSVKTAGSIDGCVGLVTKAAGLLGAFLS